MEITTLEAIMFSVITLVVSAVGIRVALILAEDRQRRRMDERALADAIRWQAMSREERSEIVWADTRAAVESAVSAATRDATSAAIDAAMARACDTAQAKSDKRVR